MKSLFWAALNLIGFVILIFMNTHKVSNPKEKPEEAAAHKLFGYLMVSVMLFLVFDTGMFILDGSSFSGAWILNYVFSLLFYIVSPLPGLFYLLYCDKKIINDPVNYKKRVFIYLIPAAVNTLAAVSTPLTHIFFYIDTKNIYFRGEYFWVSVVLAFFYVFSVYPILAIHSRFRKRGSGETPAIDCDYSNKKRKVIFIRKNIYLFLFPLPSVILSVIQVMNYGLLLIGFGFVLSAFLIYINSIQSVDDRRSLSTRFHNLNIIQFIVVSVVMMVVMFWVLEDAADKISTDYAAYNSSGTAHILVTYLNKEIGVLGAAARSKSLTEWVADESNEEKKRTAYIELMNTLSVLYNNLVYIVVGKSGREYSLDSNTRYEDFRSHAAISQNNPKDKWVFDLMAQEHEYNLNVDVDKEYFRKRIWLNFKITSGNETIGIICAGMDLSDIAAQTFLLETDTAKSRTFIIDENGFITMDSDLLGDENFLLYGIEKKIDSEVTDTVLLSAIQNHLDNIDGYFPELYKRSEVIRLNTGRYRYATITPIGTTNWSLVTLYDPSSLFSIINLLPLLLIIAVLFIIFAYSSNTMTTRMIFTPLNLLIGSLKKMREGNEQNIYGLERKDEIGLLSNAVQDYFIKGHYDALTGIYNRRYFETTLQQIMTTLSRTEYQLSLMMIDIDFFKKYNDFYGHGQGDGCLKTIADALNKSITRKADFVARYGGEEFVVVLPHVDEKGARVLAQNMLEAVRELKIPHEKSDYGIVTISIGVTTGDNTISAGRTDYLKKADEALYLSKENGRNRFTFLRV